MQIFNASLRQLIIFFEQLNFVCPPEKCADTMYVDMQVIVLYAMVGCSDPPSCPTPVGQNEMILPLLFLAAAQFLF